MKKEEYKRKYLWVKSMKTTGLLLLFAVLAAGSYGLWQEIRFPYQDYLRLHVLANSDAPADQRLKLAVRDEIILVLTPMLDGAENAVQARTITETNLSALLSAAQGIVAEHGYSYDVTAELGNFDFPDRQYDELFLPSGNYSALRIRIGEAKGHNWWCVLYPPLCLAADGQGLTTVPKEKPKTRFFLAEWWREWHGKK